MSELSLSTLSCPKCRNRMELDSGPGQATYQCKVCRSELEHFAFPRLFREFSPQSNGAKLSVDGEATCHFFPEQKAETICEECGCLLSQQAAVEWSSAAYCLPCLHKLREKKSNADFQASANLYDSRALALVTWGAPFSLLTAPIALFILLKHRHSSRGFVPRGKGRWWLAFLISISWLLIWLALIVLYVGMITNELRS